MVECPWKCVGGYNAISCTKQSKFEIYQGWIDHRFSCAEVQGGLELLNERSIDFNKCLTKKKSPDKLTFLISMQLELAVRILTIYIPYTCNVLKGCLTYLWPLSPCRNRLQCDSHCTLLWWRTCSELSSLLNSQSMSVSSPLNVSTGVGNEVLPNGCA